MKVDVLVFGYCAAITSYLTAPAYWLKTIIYFVHRICGSEIKPGHNLLVSDSRSLGSHVGNSVAECDVTALADIIWRCHHSVCEDWHWSLPLVWALGWSPWMSLSFFIAW